MFHNMCQQKLSQHSNMDRESLHTYTPKYEFFIFFASFSYLLAENGGGLIEDHFHGPGKEGPCKIVVSCCRG